MVVKFKKLNERAVVPTFAKAGDAGLDLTATSYQLNTEYGVWEYGTDLAVEIPQGYVGLIFPRSSIYKTDLSLANSVGVIDSGYRGELRVIFRNHDLVTYRVGDRVAQLVILPIPPVTPVEVDTLSDSERGAGGFGSSGR